jgi:predicted GNAT family acetyltransferase
MGVFDPHDRLRGVAAFGSVALAWLPEEETIPPVVQEALRRQSQWQSLLGETRSVTPLWSGLEAALGPPAEERIELWYAMTRSEFAPRPGSLTVRPAREADLPNVMPLRYGMFEEPEGRVLTSYEKGRLRRSCLDLIQESRLFVGEEDRRIVFAASFTVSIPEATQVSSVYTVPDRRNRGIAGAALSALCERGFAVSERMSLFVAENNEAAKRVYQRLGFKRIGVVRSIRRRSF